MRVALACPYAWDSPGGVQVHVRELGERLRGRGHEVLVLTPSRKPPVEPWVRAVGRPVEVPYNRSTAPIDPRLWSVRPVRQLLFGFQPDVVHAHEPFTPSTSMWATLSSPAPVVATFHSGAERSLLFDLASPVLRRMARRIAVRIAVSERAAAFARARLGGDFRVVPNGLDVASFAAAEPADLGPGRGLLFVGRLHRRKGFPVAVEAFRLLADRHADTRLVVAGDGEERAAADRLQPPVRARVTMLGIVPHDQLPRYYAACDLLVAPSLGGESFGYVLLEAMAAGLPVVASRIPGYDEVVRDGREGFLVPPGNPRALADAAAKVLDDPTMAQTMGHAGRTTAARYDWAVVAGQIETAYREALALR
ncbi:MAG TPA: glycosyltransferase family 4 protein [Actinomycetota bacterium]|nr:glycosyltransferase family 4 protein [Actinomycetota bacterium]